MKNPLRMKRTLVIVMLLSSLSAAKAQNIRFSIFADPQFSWFSSDETDVKPNGSIFNVHTGILMDYFFQENYAFSFGFGVNNLGGNLLYADSTFFDSKGEIITVTPNTNMKHKVQYISLPIGLTLKTEELGYLTFSFQGGFMPMFNINAHTTSDDETVFKENIQENIDLFNLNYYAGANAEYRLGGNTMIIGGVRWSAGFTDITDNDRASIKLNSIALHIGILF